MLNWSILFTFILAFLSPAGELHFAAHHIISVGNPGQHEDIQPGIEKALLQAANGDELLLPEGEFEFKKSVTITRLVSLRGAGMNKTVLYRPETIPDSVLSQSNADSFFIFDLSQANPSNIHISDMTLRSKNPRRNEEAGGSMAPDFGIRMICCLDFVITRCHFENFGKAAISVQHEDSLARGVISRNEFYNNVKGPDGLGLGYGVLIYGKNNKWIYRVNFGSDNFIFVEDNHFRYQRHAIAAAGCGLYVFRYNKVEENRIGAKSGQAIDAHEGREIPGPNYFSTRAMEIYNNTVINTTFKDGSPIVAGSSAKRLVENAILIRGGEALIHDNSIAGYRFATGIINFVVKGPQKYPIQSQIGYLSGLQYGETHSGTDSLKGNGDLFIWNNQFTRYSGSDSSSAFYNYQPDYFKENRDYHFCPKPGYKTFPYPHPLLKEW
jgi:hypothetical protein